MEPERIDVDRLLVLELERPFAAVLVLRIFPLGANTLLEEVIVGLERKIGCGRDIVLYAVSWAITWEAHGAYVDSPELLDRIKRNNFLEQLSPIVALL